MISKLDYSNKEIKSNLLDHQLEEQVKLWQMEGSITGAFD